MSVYSGFATRQQQSKYNTLLENLVIALKKRIIKFYNQQPCDETKFKLLIKKIYKKMFLLQKGKFMAPKYSTCFTDLIESLNIEINYDTMSDASSRISHSFSLKRDSTDLDEQGFKSRAVLQSKKNFLSTHHIPAMNNSTLSLSKKLNTLDVQNQISQEKRRSTSIEINPIEKSRARGRLKQLNDLKNIRGTINMPKVQDFLPKKQEIQPAFFKPPERPSLGVKDFRGFRRQKYSRNQMSIEEV